MGKLAWRITQLEHIFRLECLQVNMLTLLYNGQDMYINTNKCCKATSRASLFWSSTLDVKPVSVKYFGKISLQQVQYMHDFYSHHMFVWKLWIFALLPLKHESLSFLSSPFHLSFSISFFSFFSFSFSECNYNIKLLDFHLD